MMFLCLNPACPKPAHSPQPKYCQSCGTKLGEPFLFKNFLVTDILGEGSFGRTYLVEDTYLFNTKRVIKKLITRDHDPNLSKIKEFFAREAQQLHDLDHPQIPKLYAYFTEADGLYLVQEFIDGVNLLQEWQQRGRFSQEEILAILESLLPVLAYIQEKNVLHRDIKPENIMRRRSDRLLILIDFGAARVKTATEASQLTAIYTPGYAAREHTLGRPTPASDIYSLGVTCLRLLTGCFPDGSTDGIYDDYENSWCYREYLEKQGIKIKPSLGKILDKMIDDSLKNRYQSATEVLTDIKLINRPQLLPKQEASTNQVPKPTILGETFSFETVQVNERGKIISKETKQNRRLVRDLGKGVLIYFVRIPGGRFLMGSSQSVEGRSQDEAPLRTVIIPELWLAQTPITQAQYRQVMSKNPSRFEGDNRPVEQVSWYDCLIFCQRASQILGEKLRLPSEAEWEYACRAGTDTPFHFGPTLTPELANYDGNYSYGQGPKGVYRKQTTDVGIFPANGWGLSDCHGNVSEWCQDTYHNYQGAPTDGQAVENKSEESRIIRGGSWNSNPKHCRSSNRHRLNREYSYDVNGFRPVLIPKNP